jgi:hypothetical protein
MGKLSFTALAVTVFIIGLQETALTANHGEGRATCGVYESRRHVAKAIHRSFDQRSARPRLLSTSTSTTEVVGNIVLLEGDGSIVSEPNAFDLNGRYISFLPVGETGPYKLQENFEPFELPIGDPVTIGDDATIGLELDFEFPFFGEVRNRVFLNSDGNLTFQSAENASTARSLQRFLSGPPRIALFFADLDPSQGGTVRVARLAERLVVTWEAVPEFDKTNESTFQVILESTGRIIFRYSNSIDADTAVIGITPGGNPSDVRLLDLSHDFSTTGATLAEKFQRGRLIDNLGAVQKLYQTLSDNYDSIVMWTDFESDLDGAFAFEITVQNKVEGIGDELFDDSSIWGSSGSLESFLFMGDINRYPPSPERRVTRAGGAPSILGLLAHEFGHRWLARIRFERDGQSSDGLLGRQKAHWSFFLDSDASFLEGNDVIEESEGRFKTVEAVARYSPLDLYLMGLAPLDEVAPFFVVENGSGLTSMGVQVNNESSPQINVNFSGTKRTVLLDDILRVEGARRPTYRNSPKAFRQAWVLLYRSGQTPPAELVARLEAIRIAWEPFFQQMTLGRGNIRTNLQ